MTPEHGDAFTLQHVSQIATTSRRRVDVGLAPRPVDVAIAAVALAGSLAVLAHGGIPPARSGSQLDVLSAALAAGTTLPLLVWRRGPLAVFLITALGSAAGAAAGYSLGAPLGPTAALYFLVASRDDARPWTWRASALAVSLFLAYLVATTSARGSLRTELVLHAGLGWAVAWFAGDRSRLRRDHIAELEDRAASAEREAARERELAAAEERARIARDLHDSAGHAITFIAVRAGGARLRHDADPERSRQALAQIEEIARDTAAEIDAIVGALRDSAASPEAGEAPPGLASLGTLLDRYTATGLDIRLDTIGAPRRLEGAVDVAAYRILQEALTNAARHGVGSAEIELAFLDASIELTIANPVPSSIGPAPLGGGHGLVGMQERTTLLRGSFDANRINGTFRVRARLPYAGQAT